MLLAAYPTLFSGFAEIQGGPGDPLLVNLTLEHSYRWLTGAPLAEDLWSPPIYYPVRGVATFTDLLLGVAPLYWPWRWLGLGPQSAYQGWMLTCWAANFLAFYLLLKRGYRVSAFAASIGASLFAFGSPRMANIMHQQLVPQFFLVISILAAMELARSIDDPRKPLRDWMWATALFAGLLLQFVTAIYPLFFAGLATAAVLTAACFSTSSRNTLRQMVRRNAMALAVCAILTAVFATPVALKYLQTAEIVGMRTYSIEKLPYFFSWFLTGKFNLLYGWLHELPSLQKMAWPLHHNGVGVVTTVMCGIGLWQGRHRRAVQFMLIGLATLFVLTARLPWGHSLWPVVREIVPGAASLRAVARVGMMAIFPAAVGLAFFVDRVGTRRLWLIAPLSLLVMAEQIHTPVVFNKRDTEMRIAEIATRVPEDAEAFLLVSATERPFFNPHDIAAWVAFESGVPTVNGRYGNRPPGWRLGTVEATSPGATKKIERALRRWGSKWDLDPANIAWVSTLPEDEADERFPWARQ